MEHGGTMFSSAEQVTSRQKKNRPVEQTMGIGTTFGSAVRLSDRRNNFRVGGTTLGSRNKLRAMCLSLLFFVQFVTLSKKKVFPSP